MAYSTGSSSVVLIGRADTTAETVPTVMPALQNIDVIAVVLGDYHFGALTASGSLLTWGGYSKGALGLGDPAKIPIGQPGGFATESQRRVAVDRGHGTPPDVTVPTAVSFGKKKRFCFAAAAAGWQMGALVIDLDEKETDDEVVEEEEEDEELPVPGQHHHPLPRPPYTTQLPGQHVGILPVHSPFRVGFAGRGRGLAGGGQGGAPGT